MSAISENLLGTFLKDRRTRLDPTAFGLPMTRRRTPGLRREEVAQRANVSPTWYTWLEQGRGGAASADVLDRISRALLLTEVEREHLFLLGLGRPPQVLYRTPDPVTPRLQRVLDAFVATPATIRTSTWDIIAWNQAARAVLIDYSQVEPERRNVLRMMFCDPRMREAQADWLASARYVVAAFRADVARAGAADKVQALVDELHRISPEFAAIWAENEVRSTYGEIIKTLRHPRAGLLNLEYSSFAVDGRPDLEMVVYTPATPVDAARVAALMGGSQPSA
ncbi:helix-turn-helix transcriptional regulator [Devosia sp.]|uniref:helix-turn-helix transcriptional regulator n=1 Tax=Devosia sp. TaxID=1871048 RepID=UPI003BAB894E